LKIRAVLSWATSRCASIDYLIRADSDIVLNYANLLRFLFWLRNNGQIGTDVIAGYCRPYDCITRWPWSKTCLPRSMYEILRSSSYDSAYFAPRYCFGFSYVISRRFVQKALRIWSQHDVAKFGWERRRLFHGYWPLDDMFLTGYLAESVDGGVHRLNHPHFFNYQIKFDSLPCREHGVIASSAYEDEKEMRRRWKERWRRCHLQTG